MNNLNQDPDINEHYEDFWKLDYKYYAVIWAIIFTVLFTIVFIAKDSSASKSIDSRLSELKQLRDEKSNRENMIKEQKNAIYELDKKIVPLKCWIFNDTWAKDSWEAQCRDHFESQKQEIQKQAVQSVTSTLEEEIPE